jgi:selenocysteine-specific elongation factor
MMICTAGHVDHGKTQLVKLLTGCNTDRLKEEQERGLSIELGFAPCYLGGNLCVGVVDVPGHEKFVKNMVAGVSGIEMTVLVIAADDGIMPQTVEHVEIMELLGVRKGMVALTKIDLVSPERVQEITAEIRAFLEGTFLRGCPICPVSSETFVGYPEFYETLVREIGNLKKRRSVGVFRMPVERVFTQKGFGAVVTGIPVEGTIEIGAEVEMVPGNETGKVRGIQRFLRDATQAEYGQCLALNIPDFSKRPPRRGQVLCAPGYLKTSCQFHVRLKVVAGLQNPLRNAEEIKFHTGTCEEAGKIYFFEEKQVAEGPPVLATVVLHNPVAAAAHDRFIIRRASPARTIGGGEILAIAQEEQRARKAEVLAQLKEFVAFFESVDLTSAEGIDKRTEYFLSREQRLGGTAKDVAWATLLPPDTARESLARLTEGGKVLPLADDYYIHSEVYRACLSDVEGRVQKASTEDKLLSVTISDLHRDLNWPSPVWNRIQQDLERGNLLQRRGDKFVLPTAVQGLGDADRDLMNQILAVYERTGFQSPRPDELPGILRAPQPRIERLLGHLCNEGQLIRLSPLVLLSRNWFKKAQDLVVKIIREKGLLNSGDFKHDIHSTRKYALAILDFLDSRRVTVRIGNDRKLTGDYQRYLI